MCLPRCAARREVLANVETLQRSLDNAAGATDDIRAVSEGEAAAYEQEQQA
jgi:hypothetical protein